MERTRIGTGAFWEPVVGYRRAVWVGHLVFVAGTTAAMPEGTPIGGDDAAEQTREALRRIEVALHQVGATLEDVVQTRMFVTDIDRWDDVGRAHGGFLADIRPVTSMVEVSRLIAPDLLVEVEAVAVASGEPTPRR